MKRSFIYLAAVLAFVSCSQNEITEGAMTPVNSDVIGFSSSISGTRAAENNQTIDNLKADGFDVIGLSTDGTTLFAEPTPDGTADADKISSSYQFSTTWGWAKQTDDKKWSGAEGKYPLTFIAAYPNNDATKFGPWVKIDGTTTPNYLMDIAVDNHDGKFAARLQHNLDLLAAHSTLTTRPVSGMAPLSFKHILSKIQFQVIAPQNYKITILRLVIKNVAKEGRTYDYSKPLETAYSADLADYTGKLTNYTHLTPAQNPSAVLVGAGFAPAVGVTVPSGDGHQTDTETWKLMPQKNITAWDKAAFSAAAKAFYDGGGTDWAAFVATTPTLFAGSYIELVYRMEDADGKSIVGKKTGEVVDGITTAANRYVTVAFPLDIATVNTDKGWEPNKQYTYQIKLGTPDASNGTVTDPNYKDDQNDGTGDVIDNPRPIKPGEDITDKDGYIGFDVIVDEWADGGNTGIQ